MKPIEASSECTSEFKMDGEIWEAEEEEYMWEVVDQKEEEGDKEDQESMVAM